MCFSAGSKYLSAIQKLVSSNTQNNETLRYSNKNMIIKINTRPATNNIIGTNLLHKKESNMIKIGVTASAGLVSSSVMNWIGERGGSCVHSHT